MNKDNILKMYDKGPEMPLSIENDLMKFFNVDNYDFHKIDSVDFLDNINGLFNSGKQTKYQDLYKYYALYYMPMNIFKVWKPLIDLLNHGQIKTNNNILELGAGPGSATFGLIEFFNQLAQINPDKEFVLNINIMEKEKGFIEILKTIWSNYKKTLASNLIVSINVKQINVFREEFEIIQNYDIILESNMFNDNEDMGSNTIDVIRKLAKKLNSHSSMIFIEPGKSTLQNPIKNIKNSFKNSTLLKVFSPCCCDNAICEKYASAAAKIVNIKILNKMKDYGLVKKDIDYHYFEYLVLRNDELKNHIVCGQNITPLSEVNNYTGKTINIEAFVLVANFKDESLRMELCDGSIKGRGKVELYIPKNIMSSIAIDRGQIDRGAYVKVKKAQVVAYNILQCVPFSKVVIER